MEKAVAVKVQFGTSDKKYTCLFPSVLIGQVLNYTESHIQN